MDQQEQIAALSQAMSSVPGLDPTKGRTPVNAAVRRVWARELITKWGVSIDPAAATVEAVNTAPQLGNVGPHTMQPKNAADRTAANTLVTQNAPSFLAANAPDLAARLAAAKTQEQRDLLQAELKEKILNDPNSLVTDFLGLLGK